MANSPIQIVLNSGDFIAHWDRPPGGSNKDFFAEQDADFVAHQIKITEQLNSIKNEQIENEFADVSYAKVILRQSGIAKSHRPSSVIFKRNVAPIVGAADLGELFVELTPKSIDVLTKKILEAEPETRWKTDNKGVTKPHPTQLRSEVGVIETIIPYSAADKRNFSTSEGLEWLSMPETGGAYIVELFDNPPPRQNWDNLDQYKLKLFQSFVNGLSNFGSGLIASKIGDNERNGIMLGVRLEESNNPPIIQLSITQSSASKNTIIKKVNLNVETHSQLLKFLDSHPLVKKIILPPIITKSEDISSTRDTEPLFTIPLLEDNYSYPKIGIIDGGVSDVLSDWVEDRWGLLSPDDKDENHGTFIAGITLFGNSINGQEICRERDGCKIIDLDLLPKGEAFANYYTKPLEFFKELEFAVKELKARTGVRIFNFSLNIEEHVTSEGYSPAAKMLDKIAEENDVLFVISAGNTKPGNTRKEWPLDPIEALSILASSRNDTIKRPAESCRNISVSALNPPNLKDIVPYAPSNYSCRGPGLRIGLKPDLAHIGGCGTKSHGGSHGLVSLNALGNLVDGCGTSYAAPQVTKTLASLDHLIEGTVSRETLMGLAVHHAIVPEILTDKKLKEVAKHMVGFGIPDSSDSILAGNENSITLVFANRVLPGQKMSFNFNWPSSLVKNGKCFGYAKLTVVSTPPFDYRFGSEFVRINVDGHLRQQQANGSYLGRLKAIYTPDNKDGNLYEKDQIEHSFKWSPIKVHEKHFSGVGPSTNWNLDIEHLARDGESLPLAGVPFTALLTISDLKNNAPVFNDMRQTLQSMGVQIVDIKTAARVTPRV
ncbi:S8 family peptidase [Pedobacter panaciterrae]